MCLCGPAPGPQGSPERPLPRPPVTLGADLSLAYNGILIPPHVCPKDDPMESIKISEDLRPLSDLKSKGSDIVRQASESGRPVILTRHGRGVAAVLSIDAFEELQEQARRAELQRAVDDAERDLEAGRHVSHSDVEAKLKRWARGEAQT